MDNATLVVGRRYVVRRIEEHAKYRPSDLDGVKVRVGNEEGGIFPLEAEGLVNPTVQWSRHEQCWLLYWDDAGLHPCAKVNLTLVG